MRSRADSRVVHTYLSLDLPDEAAALKVAKDIASKVAGPVTVADDSGRRIARVMVEEKNTKGTSTGRRRESA